MVNSYQTLTVVLLAFSISGLVRGKEREIWTIGVIILMVLFLSAGGGTDFIRKFPLYFAASVMTLVGNQSGSNSLAKQSLPDPLGLTILGATVIVLIALAYYIGKRCVPNATVFSKRTFGDHVAGFFMGAVNGIFICAFLFSQGGLHLNFTIQFPDAGLTRNTIAPLVMLGIVLTLIAIAISSRKPA